MAWFYSKNDSDLKESATKRFSYLAREYGVNCDFIDNAKLA